MSVPKRIFVKAYPKQRQEAFFEGHAQAFEFFGGVPRRVSYDNLSAAVRLLAGGRIREESRAFTAFKSYYLFESHFCTPGQGHEKGGVEASAGFSRRNFLVPLPRVASFEELNEQLYQRCLANDERTVARAEESIGQLWHKERPLLGKLPARPYPSCIQKEAALNPYSQVVFETNRYSVPVERARQKLVVKAYPFRVDIFTQADPATSTPAQLIATHPRSYQASQDILDPLHYPGLLEQRPGAFEYTKPLKQWRQNWPQVYHRALGVLQENWPGGRGIKEFVKILKLHETYKPAQIEAALHRALDWGCLYYDGVVQALQQPQNQSEGVLEQLRFKELDLSDKPHLSAVKNQSVDLAVYNQLLLPTFPKQAQNSAQITSQANEVQA